MKLTRNAAGWFRVYCDAAQLPDIPEAHRAVRGVATSGDIVRLRVPALDTQRAEIIRYDRYARGEMAEPDDPEPHDHTDADDREWMQERGVW